MKLKDVGERELLKLARKLCSKGPEVVVGVGDDAAVMSIDDEYLVATTDMLVEKTHFLPQTPAEQIGCRAVVTNLSDLASMGAEPLGLVFSIGAPRETEVDFIKGLLKSMDRTAGEYGIHVVGGDLNESEHMIVSGTGFGVSSKGRLLLRTGAEEGDLIAVTGDLGASSAGMKILFENLSGKKYRELAKKFAEPVARVGIGQILSESGAVTSAIDLTDGLAANLWQLSRMSEAKFTVGRKKIPVNPKVKDFSREYGFDLDDFVLFGGEEFELLFTIKREKWKDLRQRILDEEGVQVTAIGEVAAGKGVYLREGGKVKKMPELGYEHFR